MPKGAVDCISFSSPDRVLDDTLRSSLFCQLMYLSPVTLLGIYLYGLCGVAYIGKPICILILQKMLGMLLLYVLLQCWVCACDCSGLVKIIAQNVHPACALSPHQQSCRHLYRSDQDVAVCNERMLGLHGLVAVLGQSYVRWCKSYAEVSAMPKRHRHITCSGRGKISDSHRWTGLFCWQLAQQQLDSMSPSLALERLLQGAAL